ncbi:MAG: SPOR domain-containing protein [Hyphomicrobiaceae bacterium]
MPTPAPRRRGGKIYLMLWLLLAAGAIVYLGALTLVSNPMTALFGSPKPATSEPNDVAEGPTTVELKEEIASLRDEIEAVRGELRTVSATSQVLADKVDTIENASIQVQGSDQAEAQNVSQGKAKAKATSEASDITGIVIGADESSEDVAASEPEVQPVKKPKKQQVAATEAAPEASSEEVAQPAKKKTFGLELAVSTSPEALQLNWDLLNERHGDLLKGLTARTQANAADPSSYRLLAGPFANAQQAQSACAKLKKQNVACQVTGFGGDNL